MKRTINITNIDKELDRYRAKLPDLAKIIDFYQHVFRIQESTLGKAGSALSLNPEDILKGLKENKFVLSDTTLPLDDPLFRETAKELAKAFSEVSGQPFPVEDLLSLPQLKDVSDGEFVKDLLYNKADYIKKFAVKTSFNEETIFLFLHSLLVPFFQRAAEDYEEIIQKAQWSKGNCPFCGSTPRYASFHSEDGKRLLYCPLCRTQWRFLRMACPFCYNSDHKKLRHFHIEEDKAHRADVCQECNRYIKTTNNRDLARETIPQVEDIVTLPLDILAAREGYSRES
ncbi:MAG: formate dehydrogenase accessory protein FdhE [Chloroflexi bacterium]|nr:formate dehydrogenase accessory protein FdhE [Chloroflexota bacterium]